MVIMFDGIVRYRDTMAKVIGIVPVAAIDTIRLDEATTITYQAGNLALPEDIRAGMRVKVRGCDRGGNELRASSVVILERRGSVADE